LRSALEAESLHAALVRHILSSYEQEIAADLVDLVAEALPEMQDWLDSQASLRRRGSA
jgi:hypothetical protein